MHYNPFIMQYRKQPNRKMPCRNCNPMNQMAGGMVTLGSIAVLGNTTVGIINAFKS